VNNPSTSGINLVGFCLLTPELRQLNCDSRRRSALGLVQLCSRGVALLGTAAIGFVSLLFARGYTAMPGRLHARLCHAFLVY